MTEKLYVVVVNLKSANEKIHILNPSAVGANNILSAVRMGPGENFIVRTFLTLPEAEAFATTFGDNINVVEGGTGIQ